MHFFETQGSDGILETYEAAEKLALEIGFPVMLKATAGGGGKGMRAVYELEQFQSAWDSARQEADAAFGNDGMYMEKLKKLQKLVTDQLMRFLNVLKFYIHMM